MSRMLLHLLTHSGASRILLGVGMALLAAGQQASAQLSDDFAEPAISSGIWTFVNPLSDASSVMVGGRARVIVPATGQIHDAWTDGNTLPRLRQPITDTDFMVEAKFDHSVTTDFQSQGILVEDGAGGFLRVEYHFFGGSRRFFVGSVVGGIDQVHASLPMQSTAPVYLRVGRVGTTWTAEYSFDNATWTGLTFTRALSTAFIGIYAGNSANTANAAAVDYFFNSAAPIVPEDGALHRVNINIVGQGAIDLDPNWYGFMPGESVTLNAVPEPAWQFEGWSGDIVSTDNPLMVTLGASDIELTATFTAPPDNDPPVISNIVATPDSVNATISWTTDEPSDSVVLYGPNSPTLSVADGTLVTSHQVLLTNLDPNTKYFYQVESTDASDNTAQSAVFSFTTLPPPPPALISDDFSDPNFSGATWEFVNPLADSSAEIRGGWARINVVGGAVAHDAWVNGNTLPRLRQPVADVDFGVEVKFESDPAIDIQTQGLLFEETDDDVLRVEVQHIQGERRLFVATILGGVADIKANFALSAGPRPYLRVDRAGAQWTVWSSADGAVWTQEAQFNTPMLLSAVSIYGGNSPNLPYIAKVDYFADLQAPIVNEDGTLQALTTEVFGLGAIAVDPNQTQYAPGEVVDLTAMPDLGWEFVEWQLDASGASPTTQVTIGANGSSVRAVFQEIIDLDPPIISNVVITPGESTAEISWTTDELATSRVRYATDADFGGVGYTDDVNDPTFTTNHAVTLTGLAAGTLYHIEISSTDVADNVAAEPDQTFSTTAPVDPNVEIWYGANQSFGDLGVSQQWVNILGTVTDESAIASLSYTLNGGTANALSIGPDLRRLGDPGDFVIEIDEADLLEGLNLVQITATDSVGATRVFDVNVTYNGANVWPLPYAIDWSTTAEVTDAVQVVDGRWDIVNDALRPTVLEYDRAVTIGDRNWTNYEVLVPITLHGLDPNGYRFPSISPGFGITLRWPGHTDWDGSQPRYGWEPTGAGIWYDAGGAGGGGLTLGGDDGLSVSDPNRVLQVDTTYMYRFRVQQDDGIGTLYRAKVWEEGSAEPNAWDLEGHEATTDLPAGSCVIIAHHTDISIGDVLATPLDVIPDLVPPQILNLTIEPGESTAIVRFDTDEPTSALIEYGDPNALAESVAIGGLQTSFEVVLTDLAPATNYACRVTVTDRGDNDTQSAVEPFATLAPTFSSLESDDFSDPNATFGRWAFVNPTGAASFSVVTAGQSDYGVIAIPSIAVPHDAWIGENTLPRISQSTPDENFLLEAVFDSQLAATGPGKFASQGLLLEQDNLNFLRIERQIFNGVETVFIATVTPGGATVHTQELIEAGSFTFHFRVLRDGDVRMIEHSVNGVDWSAPLAIVSGMMVNNVSVYGGSSPNTPNEAWISYFDVSGEAPSEPCMGDINNDGVRNSTDLSLLLTVFGASGPDLPEDLNDDGIVDSTDLSELLAMFGAPCN